jgi:hypothetical protein
MASLLSAFLSEAGRRGFARGRNDCMLFAADWVERLTGRDPAAEFRSAYDSAEAANAILQERGGSRAIVASLLQPLGWRRVDTQRAGDIALVIPPTHTEEIAAVCVDDRRVALLSLRGVVVWPLQPVEVWRHG